MRKRFEEIARKDGRFNARAFRFVYEGLGHTTKKAPAEPDTAHSTGTSPYHVTGQALCEELRKLAVEKWGRLAMLVLNTWNVKTTRDFGEIVYLMIENKWMSAQPTDSIDDFNDVYDFKTIFKDQFQF